MKKFILSLFAVACLSPVFSVAPTETAAAETKYSRITGENVVLYMDAAMTTPWFTLPYGYYVKVLSISASSVKAEYKDGSSRPSAKGYIAASELDIVSEPPTTAYPSLTLTVNQTCMLYKDVDFSLTETITQNSTLDFYGIYEKAGGNKYIYGYVSTTAGDKYVGYIPYDAVYEFTPPRLEIEVEPEPEPETPKEDETKKETSTSDGSDGIGNVLQIVIIIAVSLVAVSIVYFLFRPAGNKAKDEALSDDG